MPTKSQWTRIIQAYLDNGGAKMDEEAYQSYKQQMLNNWIERYFFFHEAQEAIDTIPDCDCDSAVCREDFPNIHRSFHYAAIPERWECRTCSLLICADYEEGLAHLRIHFPEWFQVDENDKKKVAKKGE